MPSPPSEADRRPVPPGSGWPGDRASPVTPVAHSPAEVRALAAAAPDLDELDARSTVCRACPRLVDWREQVARTRRAAYVGERYWGRPVGSFGPPDARILLLGLAPAAHGGNRTGRIFTGDRSGDWLFAALHRAGLASSPRSVSAGDGQRLIATRMTAAVRCAPPGNAPTPAERDTCRGWLARELALPNPRPRVVVTLGGFAWSALWPALAGVGFTVPVPRVAFGHGRRVDLDVPTPLTVLGCYHPSQQNTFTGRVTEPMLDDVFRAARAAAGIPG